MTSPTPSTSFTSPRVAAGRPARAGVGSRKLVPALLAGCTFLLVAVVVVMALGVVVNLRESAVPQGEFGTSSTPSEDPAEVPSGVLSGGIVEVVEHTVQGAVHGLSVLVSGQVWSSSVASSSSSSSSGSSISTGNGPGGRGHGPGSSTCPSGERLAALYRQAGPAQGREQAHAVGHVRCAGGFAVVRMASPQTGETFNTIFRVGPPLRLLGTGSGPVCTDDPSEHGSVLVGHKVAETLGCATASGPVTSGPPASGSPSGHEPGAGETTPSSGSTAGGDDVEHQGDGQVDGQGGRQGGDPAGAGSQTPTGTSDQPAPGGSGDPALEQGTEGTEGAVG